jgi:alpha-maltose-1-phosphate synthase
MNVVLSTSGKFHYFALARQLEQRGLLEAIFTGYPKFKLKNEVLPEKKIKSFPWLRTLHVLSYRLHNPWLSQELEWMSMQAFDTHVSRSLPDCGAFFGISGAGLKTGKVAKSRGAVYICDRISSHIRYQDALLRAEYARQGQVFEGIPPRVIAQEEAEYELSDLILVPSSFARRSFIEMGVPEAKLRLVPLGVELEKFHPVTKPDSNSFEVLFVGNASYRKGIPDLLAAFSLLQHPQKRLTIVGTVQPELVDLIDKAASAQNIVATGHMAHSELKQIMSRSHVMVLPSIEDGFGYVQAEAMACGCPVIATTNTGAADLFSDRVEGFIVPVRAPEALVEKMQLLADNPDLQQRMAIAALAKVKTIGGWTRYGTAIAELLSNLNFVPSFVPTPIGA